MTAFKQVTIPTGFRTVLTAVGVGDLLNGQQVRDTNLPLGSVVRYTEGSHMTWYLTRNGWINYDGDFGYFSDYGYFKVIHIPWSK